MINRIASKVGKALASPVAESKYYSDRFTKEEIEQIITYDMINNIKQAIWLVLLIISTYFFLFLGIDIRLTTLIIFITIVAFRNRLGGYHADSPKVCLAISTIIPISFACLTVFVDFSIYLIVAIYIFAYYTAFKKRVVDHPDRRFEEGNNILNLDMENRLFKTGIALLIIVNIIHIYLLCIGQTTISDAITAGVIISFTNLHFGK